MADEVSIAEEAGRPFQTRCEGALALLKGTLALAQRLSTENVQSLYKLSPMIVEALFTSSNKLARLHRLTEINRKLCEEYYTSLREYGLELSREIWGSDATDFALKAMKLGGKGN